MAAQRVFAYRLRVAGKIVHAIQALTLILSRIAKWEGSRSAQVCRDASPLPALRTGWTGRLGLGSLRHGVTAQKRENQVRDSARAHYVREAIAVMSQACLNVSAFATCIERFVS
jgi:hypothetical protein